MLYFLLGFIQTFLAIMYFTLSYTELTVYILVITKKIKTLIIDKIQDINNQQNPRH